MTAAAQETTEARVAEIAEEQAGAEAVRQLLAAGTEEHRVLLDAAIEALRAYVEAREALAAKTIKLESLKRKARKYGLPVPPSDSYGLRFASNDGEEIRKLHYAAMTATRGSW